MKIKCILFGFIFLMAVYSFSSQKTLRYKTFWFGNTFSGKKVWVQDSILDIYVSKSGTIYGATIWDEGGREFGIYKNGKVIGGCEDTHGWGVGGGPTVTANKKYIFISNLQSSGAGGWMWAQQPSTYTKFPPPGYIYYGVSRYNKNGSIATFPGAQGNENQMLVLNITKEGEKPEYIEGLAADTNYLFVSNTAANEIEVFNPNTMKYIREWKVNHPERIALGNNKNLWVIQKYGIGKYKISVFTHNGKKLPYTLNLPKTTIPDDIAIGKNDTVYISYKGLSQQILIFKRKGNNWILKGKLGEKYGIYAGPIPGKAGPYRFSNPVGVGVDGNGNIYVACNQPEGGTIIRCFSPDKKFKWQILDLEWVDAASANPNTIGKKYFDVYTTKNEYALKFKDNNISKWKWIAQTLDPFKYPDDPRIWGSNAVTCAPLIRDIDGKKFLILTGMYTPALVFYKFKKNNDISIPSAMICKQYFSQIPNCPQKGMWIWRNLNGKANFQKNEFENSNIKISGWGMWVDKSAGVWIASRYHGIYYFQLMGIDKKGNPIYSFSSMVHYKIPKGMIEIDRAIYNSQQDIMYLSGFTTKSGPRPLGLWGSAGAELWKIENWKKGNRRPTWEINFPLFYKPHNPAIDHVYPLGAWINSLYITGNYVFAAEIWSSKIHIYSIKNGREIGIINPIKTKVGRIGWQDFRNTITAIKINRKYLIFEEDDWKGKIVVYVWTPPYNK
jgi:sugar lactone lactonase YvrE